MADVRTVVWALATLAFAAWVMVRLGAFSVWATATGPDGRDVRLPDSFATVDHSFHAVRAETLRRALLDGDLLRWVAHHQGGYPVEFYPLGVAWVEVGVWAAAFGTLPIEHAHKLVVLGVFLLPGLAFWLLARLDGWSPVVAFAALAAHVAVPGGWWHGGYTELVLWGLVTNVAAAASTLFVLWGLVAFLHRGSHLGGAVAAVAAAFSTATNPRSLVALVIVGVGTWLACLGREPDGGPFASLAARRVAAVGLVGGALAAPELGSLARFSDLYHFVQYQWYETLGEYVRNSIDAVSPVVVALAVAGVALGLVVPRRPATRTIAVTLVLYVAATAILRRGPGEDGVLEQLEATRLMPFQRLLVVYLAAVALDAGLRAMIRRRESLVDGIVAAAALALVVACVHPVGVVRAESRSLYPILSTATPEQADFLDAIRVADDNAPPGHALLVLGTTLGTDLQWHQQLWAPLETDRPLFYDNWLWYWHADHAGPWNYRLGHHYPPERWIETLDRAYLDRHGIAAVVVIDGRVASAAEQTPHLRRLRDGMFDVYLVADPAPIVTFPGGETATTAIGNERIVATGESRGGEATIARNWHPRWRATVNGERVEAARTQDGYIAVPVPAGPITIELTYAVDRWDWLARLISLLGLVAVIALALPRRWRPARFRRFG